MVLQYLDCVVCSTGAVITKSRDRSTRVVSLGAGTSEQGDNSSKEITFSGVHDPGSQVKSFGRLRDLQVLDACRRLAKQDEISSRVLPFFC